MVIDWLKRQYIFNLAMVSYCTDYMNCEVALYGNSIKGTCLYKLYEFEKCKCELIIEILKIIGCG